jgi:hypothetical protein
MKYFPLLILDLSYQLKCLMAQQGRPHLDILFIIIIININININYLLHLLLDTIR